MPAPVISVRTNYSINPSVATTISPYNNGGTPATITRDTTVFFSGVASIKVVTSASGGGVINNSGGIADTAANWNGQLIAASFMVNALAGVSMSADIRAPGLLTGSTVNWTGTGAWQRIDIPGVTVTSATVPYVLIRSLSATATTFYVDDIQVERANTIYELFSGDTPNIGNTSYVWTGTANASTSVATTIAPYVAYGQQNQLMFGTTQKMQLVRVPSTGMGRTRKGYNAATQLENGGMFIYEPSRTRHLEYKFDFGTYEATGSGGLDVYADYAQGFYGNGNIYFSDPMYYDINLFSYMWSAPGMVARPYTLSGVGGVTATVANTQGQPVNSMITPIAATTANDAYDSTYYAPTIIPIPPGFTLWLGWSGSVSDGGYMRAESWQSGAAALTSSQTLTPLSVTGTTRLNASFVGSSTVEYVKVGYSRSGGTSPLVTVTSMMAQLWPTGMIPTLTGSFQSGQGNNGCRFLDDAVEETYVLRDNQMRNVHYKGLSFSIAEVGSWQ